MKQTAVIYIEKVDVRLLAPKRIEIAIYLK